MEVRLTDKSRATMGWGPDRIKASVSDKRAFTWMGNGMAVPDKNFMALYAGNNPEPEPEPAPEKPKKEKAVSRRAEKREKAITEDEKS